MSNERNTRPDSQRTSWGVRTIDDLRARCRVDDITGCWHWAGKMSSGKWPMLWFPPLQRRVSLGVAIGYLRTGREPEPGVIWHCLSSCETANCANPSHRRAGNRSTQMLAAQLTRDPATRARIANAKRAASDLRDDQAAEIRASSEPLRVIAKRYGISISSAQKIRCGARRAPTLLGSSVFTFARGDR